MHVAATTSCPARGISAPCDLRSTAGFTLIEMMVVLVVIGIVSAITIFGVQAAIPSAQGDSAMDSVLSMMRLGRDSAVTMRRPIEVRFPSPSEIDIVRIDPGSERVIGSAILEGHTSFMLTAGVPDTPDAYGNATATYFGGAPIVRFNEDGTMSDGLGVPLNGTVFLGQPTEVRAARAVTVTGVTGRAQGYAWDGRQWQEK